MSNFPPELEAALASVAKQYGKTALLPLGSGERLQVEVIPSSSLAIDSILGIGGFPRGRVVEIYGPESGGKTTLTLHVIAQAQRAGGIAAFIDAEHALDPTYARKLGVDTDNLLVSQPDNGEQALEIAEAVIKSNSVDVIVIDSVAALVPRAELEGDMGQPQMGLQARLMSQALRKLTGVTHKSKTCLIFINQVRDKIGQFFAGEVTTGGRALKFYASIRLDIRKIQTAADKESNTVRVKCVKNKCAVPFKEVECTLRFGEGIDGIGDLITLGIEHGYVEKSGSWLTVGGQRVQGMDSARAFLKESPEIAGELESALRTKLFGEKL